MQLRELVGMPDLKLDVSAARAGLDVEVTGVLTIDLRGPDLHGHEAYEPGRLVLAGLEGWPGGGEALVRRLVGHGVAGLALGTRSKAVPGELVEACERHGLPLLTVLPEVSFDAIAERVPAAAPQSAGPPEGDGAGSASARWRGMIATVAAGEGAARLLAQAGGDVGAECTLITSTGRVVAGPVPDPEALDRLTAGYLGAARLPQTVRGRTAWTVVGVDRPARRLGGWFLAVPATGLTPARQSALADLAAAVDLERSRLEQGARAERRLADRLLAAIDDKTCGPAELEVARQASGLPGDRPLLTLSATRPGPADDDDGSGDAESLRVVLEDVLLGVAGDPVVAAGTRGEVVAFLAADPGDANAAGRLTAAVRQSAGRVARTPARERLCVGVSGPARSLRALAEEARQARRVAECSPARVAVLTRDEVDSHVVLLAGLPGSLRTGYHRRLLTPVVEYDARHRTELLQTLECFLEHSGSWSVAAQKLHVHVNTLRYRVGRIEQLTGRTLTRLEHQVDLFLALRARG